VANPDANVAPEVTAKELAIVKGLEAFRTTRPVSEREFIEAGAETEMELEGTPPLLIEQSNPAEHTF
jgi:hypothetical protein